MNLDFKKSITSNEIMKILTINFFVHESKAKGRKRATVVTRSGTNRENLPQSF